MLTHFNVRTWAAIPFSLLMAVFIGLAGCENSSNSDGSKQETPDEPANLFFNITLEDLPNEASSTDRSAGGSRNICQDYLIESIQAVVNNNASVVMAEKSWPCSDHQGSFNEIPPGTDYRITIAATVGGEPKWRGEIAGVVVLPGKRTEAGTVVLKYYSRL